MAVTGTASQQFTENGALYTNISGVTQGSSSVVIALKVYTMSSYTIAGTYGAGASLQWQGSNDNGATWVNVGPALTATSIQSGTLTPDGLFYRLYQLVVTGGDGTTNISSDIIAVIPR